MRVGIRGHEADDIQQIPADLAQHVRQNGKTGHRHHPRRGGAGLERQKSWCEQQGASPHESVSPHGFAQQLAARRGGRNRSNGLFQANRLSAPLRRLKAWA